MSEEMRKEFEYFCERESIDPVNMLFREGEYVDNQIHLAWSAWQASREAMRPIKLPVKMKNTEAAECYYYNDAIDECKEAIEQAGYKVAP